jgi:flagellar basal-body rod protein FlgF
MARAASRRAKAIPSSFGLTTSPTEPQVPPLNGMDSAASALRYWERKQEIVANNLANVSTDGFKAQRVFARLLDGVRPVADTTSDLTTGNLRSTGNSMDVAVDGSGFFVVQTPQGERYTRGGSLRLDDKHQLVDAEGRPLLGEKGAPLKLLDGPIEISKTGEVTQKGQIVDRLKMESAPKGTELQREGESLWVPPANKEILKPDARNVKQGYIEESNVNSMTSLVDMVAVQRAYASVQKAVVTMDQANETITTQIAKPL